MALQNEIVFQVGASAGAMKKALTGMSGLTSGLRGELDKLSGQQKSIEAFQRLRESIPDNERALQALGKEKSKDRPSSRIAGRRKELEGLQQTLRAGGISAEDVEARNVRLAMPFEQAKTARENLAKAANSGARFQEAFGAASKSLAPLIGAASSFTRVSLGMTEPLAAAASDAEKAAASLGLSSRALQEFRYAAGLFGMSAGQLDGSLKTLRDGIRQGAGGEGEAAEALHALGLSAAGLSRVSAEESLMSLARAFSRLEDPARQAGAATSLFGENGRQMLRMFRGGAEGLATLRAEAVASGYVIGNEALAQAAAYTDAKNKMASALTGMRNTLGTALLPFFTAVFGQIASEIGKNRARIISFAVAFGNGLQAIVPHLGELFAGMGRVLSGALSLTLSIGNMPGGFENLGALIGGALFVKPLWGLGRMGLEAVQLGLDIFGATKSMLAFISAGGGMTAFVAGCGGQLAGAFSAIRIALTGLAAAVGAHPLIAAVAGAAMLAACYWDDIKAAGVSCWEGLKNAWSAAGEFFSQLRGSVAEVSAMSWNGLIGLSGQVCGEIKAAWNTAGEFFARLRASVSGVFAAAWQGLAGAAGQAWEAFKAPAVEVFDWLARKFEWVNEGFAKIGEGWEAVKRFFGGGEPAEAGKVAATGDYARGGIVAGPAPARVGERGNLESVIPHDGSGRSLELWARTGAALGVTSPHASAGLSGISVSYAPAVTIQGNADTQSVEQALDLSVRNLSRFLDGLLAENARTALA